MPATTAFRNDSSFRPFARLAAFAAFVVAVIAETIEMRARLTKRYNTYE